MSGADYLHCAVCGAKALYDAEVDYDYPNLGAIVALCKECRKTHMLKPISDDEIAAHDAGVRADQREKDAQIAESFELDAEAYRRMIDTMPGSYAAGYEAAAIGIREAIRGSEDT